MRLSKLQKIDPSAIDKYAMVFVPPLLTPLRNLQMRGAFTAAFTSKKMINDNQKSWFRNWPLISNFFIAHLSIRVRCKTKSPKFFWAPNGTRLSARCHFTGPKKLSNSSAQPRPTSLRICTHPKPYALGCINHRCVSKTQQFRAYHLLGLSRMDALTRLRHIGFGGFSPRFTIPRFLHPTGWWIY